MCELKWSGVQHFQSDIFYSCHKKIRIKSVALVLREDAEQAVMGYNIESDLITSIRRLGKSININTIQVYTSSHGEEIKIFLRKVQRGITHQNRMCLQSLEHKMRKQRIQSRNQK